MDRIFAEAARARGKASEGLQDGASSSSAPSSSTSTSSTDATAAASAPAAPGKGVVLGPDGKPCRTCTSSAAWSNMMKMKRNEAGTSSKPSPSSAPSSSAADFPSATPSLPAECPPDVERLGRHTWTLLHGMAAAYPERADAGRQEEMRGFLGLFSRLYPCWACASDLQEWMARPGNGPRLEGRERFGRWMCDAHNEVNRKLGKPEFDCAKWRERWVDGWQDGRCDG